MGGGSGTGGLEPVVYTEQKALVVGADEAWLLNFRVRDLLTPDDLPASVADMVTQADLEGDWRSSHYLADPRPLALGIIRALRDLRVIKETSILVSEEECWFLERRFRHNDREPEARSLIQKIHDLLIAFHPELVVDLGLPEAEESADDRTYENPDKDTSTDAEPEPGTDAGAPA